MSASGQEQPFVTDGFRRQLAINTTDHSVEYPVFSEDAQKYS